MMRLLVLAIVSLTLVSAGACLPAQQYSAIDLGPGVAYSINDAGQITGGLNCADGRHVFFATATQMTDLGLFGGYAHSRGYRINNGGQIVGDLYNDAYSRAAFMWDPNSGFQILSGVSCALGISDNGLVAGYHGSILPSPVLWSATDTVPKLQVVTGYNTGLARDVNDLGQAVGNVDVAHGDDAAFWNADGTLVRIPAVASESFARSINNLGEVVGISYNGYAWKWSISDGLTQLANLPGMTGPDVYDINDLGQIVGASEDHAVLWDLDGSICELIPPDGFIAAHALGINNRGQVVGNAFLDGVGHAILWTPVPEPSSSCAVILGLMGIGAAIRRRTH